MIKTRLSTAIPIDPADLKRLRTILETVIDEEVKVDEIVDVARAVSAVLTERDVSLASGLVALSYLIGANVVVLPEDCRIPVLEVVTRMQRNALAVADQVTGTVEIIETDDEPETGAEKVERVSVRLIDWFGQLDIPPDIALTAMITTVASICRTLLPQKDRAEAVGNLILLLTQHVGLDQRRLH